MHRPSASIVLAVFGVGVFLAGLELMVTAVALPAILENLASNATGTAWVELRKASWIINGYLLVYVLTMPLAGRVTDLWGARRPFLAAIGAFVVGSTLAGLAQSMDQLIAARLVQGVGGGILVPVGTAAAAHLFEGHDRSRALGVIGGLTFLGMAAGPFAGAAILGSVHPETALTRLGLGAPWTQLVVPAWRWVFFLNVPIGIVAGLVGWAASAGWDTPRRAGRLDLVGAAWFGIALLALLVGLTLIGTTTLADVAISPDVVIAALVILAVIATTLVILHARRTADPFLDPRLFRIPAFAAAALVSLLTGYAFATAIIGGAVFVDRVLYGGPDQQRLALGALAAATAIGALASGFLVRVLSLRLVTVAGLILSIVGLVAMSRWDAATPIGTVALTLAAFGGGFGLTVTPRSTAAVEAAGRRAFGTASSVVTVARMIGMAIGLAILTAYGSTTIDRLADQIYATPTAYQALIPAELRGRDLKDPLVVGALETWASREAAGIMVGLFLVAAAVSAVAIAPSLVLGARPRMLAGDVATTTAEPATNEGPDPDDHPAAEPGIAR